MLIVPNRHCHYLFTH